MWSLCNTFFGWQASGSATHIPGFPLLWFVSFLWVLSSPPTVPTGDKAQMAANCQDIFNKNLAVSSFTFLTFQMKMLLGLLLGGWGEWKHFWSACVFLQKPYKKEHLILIIPIIVWMLCTFSLKHIQDEFCILSCFKCKCLIQRTQVKIILGPCWVLVPCLILGLPAYTVIP